MAKKTNLRLTAVAILAVLTFSVSVFAATYSGGTGEPNNPYLISTAADMNAIGADMNDWDKHFLLINDINLADYTGTQFNIIGYYVSSSDNKPFTGVFDGNNHTISNFTYDSDEVGFIGLFGYANGQNGIIKELNLIDPNINAEVASYVGSLVGYLKEGTITGCDVKNGKVTGNSYVGGLIGGNESGTISNCFVTVSVSGSDSCIGGLVGVDESGTISRCSAASSVSGYSWIGGLIGGKGFGIISDSYVTGSTIEGNYTTGGLVGNSSCTILRCYAAGDVSGHSETGGLVGGVEGGLISDCYATSTIDGNNRIGGLVGYNSSGTISNCYMSGIISGNTNTGGMVGYHFSGAYNKCFWDSDVNPDVNGIGNASDPNVIGKSTAEMQTKSTFTTAGWDFTTSVWKMCNELNYPKLWWEECRELMTYYVDANGTGDYATIQAAIDDSNDGDVIVLEPGTYTGDGNRNINILDKAITVRSTDPNDPNVVAATIIDCNGSETTMYRGFYFFKGNSSLGGLTITNGKNISGGAAIYCSDSSPTIYNLILTGNGNAGGAGGAIRCWKSNPIIKNCLITGNTGDTGGGIQCGLSNPEISNCTFSRNSANNGGGIAISNGSPILINCVFRDNSAGQGGGASITFDSNPILVDCRFDDNTAEFHGGAIYCRDSSGSVFNNCRFSSNSAENGGCMFNFKLNNMKVTNCIFNNNRAEYGGAMLFLKSNNSMLKNSIFTGNIAEQNGDAIFCDNSNQAITGCTFAQNLSPNSNTIACDNIWGSSPSSLQIVNSILWDGGNEIWNNDNSSINIVYSNIQGSWAGEGNIDTDPCFADPCNGDYYLLENSPCINAGDPNYIPEPNETDLDGNPRIINEIIDMGAFEFQPLSPAELLLDLTDYINELSLHKGIANSLQSKLDAALQLLEDGNENNDVAAVNLLEAFINAAEAKRGKKISQANADILIAVAQEILELLSDEQN